MENSPPLGSSTVVSSRIVVVLPAPLGPSSPMISPWDAEKLTFSTALCTPKCLVSSTASTVMVVIGLPDFLRPRVRRWSPFHSTRAS